MIPASIGRVLVIAALLQVQSVQAQLLRTALFIGNSYTAVNNLPLIVHDIAASTGDTLFYDASTPGGYSLQAHSTNANTLSFIAQGGYDFMVLQEQSQRPALPLADVASLTLPYARLLDSLARVHDPCVETVFYRTWGRKNGDASLCPTWPPVCTYAGMDSLLALRYRMMADSNDAFLAPVGDVWKYLRMYHPSIELYDNDESHPSAAGSYAAAMTFYTVFFRKDPLQVSYDYSLIPNDAAIIRNAVKHVVYDSLITWNVGKWDPYAGFTISYPFLQQVALTNTSLNASYFFWDFGDGSTDTSSQSTVFHTYQVPPYSFTVTLVASHCQQSDTFAAVVTPLATGVKSASEGEWAVWPNPARDVVHISNAPAMPMHCRILSMDGVCHRSIRVRGPDFSLGTSLLPAGMYLLELCTGGEVRGRVKVLLR